MIASLLLFLPPAACFAADWQDYYVNSWHDDTSGYDIFNLSPANENVTGRMILLHDLADDRWLRLPNQYTYLGQNWNRDFPGLGLEVDIHNFNPYASYYFDVKKKLVVSGKQYNISPDGRWGLQENHYYESWSRTKSFLIKNMQTGDIAEWLKTSQSLWYYWMPDSRILYCTYSPAKKQNVIFIFNPADKTETNVISGSLRGYAPKKNLILFEKNEPLRQSRILDLASQKERLAQSDDDSKIFYPDEAPLRPSLPNDLDLGSIDILIPQSIAQYEAEMSIGDQSIPLPYTFWRNETEFIPLRPLMKPLGIQVDIRQISHYNREYRVSYQGKEIALHPKDMINYQWQLFVTPELLEKLGLPEFKISKIIN